MTIERAVAEGNRTKPRITLTAEDYERLSALADAASSRTPDLAAGLGSSLELIHPEMDNSRPSAWRDSIESNKAPFWNRIPHRRRMFLASSSSRPTIRASATCSSADFPLPRTAAPGWMSCIPITTSTMRPMPTRQQPLGPSSWMPLAARERRNGGSTRQAWRSGSVPGSGARMSWVPIPRWRSTHKSR
mgnify:CR=1 FL=1